VGGYPAGEEPAGAAALRAACCDVLARVNAAECFCQDEVGRCRLTL